MNTTNLKYPRGVFFIIICEYFERYAFFGSLCMSDYTKDISGILTLYIRNSLSFEDENAKIVFHFFCALVYSCPLIGAVIADSFLGKFGTIILMGVVLICGNILLFMSALSSVVGSYRVSICLIGLLLKAFGGGSIKSCITPFGGDQFVMPQQVKQLHSYFTIFYFAINVGNFMSTIITPMLKENVVCFGEEDCYPLAYGVSTLMVIIALIIFVSGKSFYTIRKPTENVICLWIQCVQFGIKTKMKSEKNDQVEHWLDRCEEKFDKTFVQEVKTTVHVLLLFVPNIFFWALFDQQGSGWTLQAARMMNEVGSYKILPEQMITANTLLILILIPVFSFGVYPLFAKCYLITKPLQRMMCGGMLAAFSFIIAACVSFAIECSTPSLPTEGECHIRIYNLLNCTAKINAPPFLNNTKIKPMGYEKLSFKGVKKTYVVPYRISGCNRLIKKPHGNDFRIVEQESMGYYLKTDGLHYFKDDISRHKKEYSKVRVLVDKSIATSKTSVSFRHRDKAVRADGSSQLVFHPGSYEITNFRNIHVDSGGVYTLLVSFRNENVENIVMYEITEHYKIHILWQLPQYFVMAAAAVMLFITGTEFASTQAPNSMKAVMSAAWLLTSSIGNIAVVLIEAMKIFESQSSRFLLYSGIMILAMGIFGRLSKSYTYVTSVPIDQLNENRGY